MRKFFRNITGYKTEPETEAEDTIEAGTQEENEDEETEEETQILETDGEDESEEEEEESDGIAPANGTVDDEDNKWLGEEYEEGQLSIDVYQTPLNIVVKSTIAGVKPDDIDISINNDLLTIRGKREMSEIIKDENYLFRECYWGSFSRSVILPVEVIPEKIDASLENGVLTVILPKAKTSKQISIKVKGK